MSYTNGNRPQIDDDDVEEEALVADYQEQVNNYVDGADLTRADSLTGGPADLRAQLEAAAAPLEYQASLETKFASYDNYCSLFHYILNSDGPVEVEQPSYYWAWDVIDGEWARRMKRRSFKNSRLTEISRVHLSVRILLPLPQSCCKDSTNRRGDTSTAREPKYLGLLLRA